MAEPIRILILEDNASDAELMKRELGKAGFDFTAQWVQNKEAFLAALDTFTPDLILADYSLPGFDGLTALVLARQRGVEVPVIIVSGVIGEEVATETLKAGATDYVLKQRLSRLGPAVRRALREAEQLAQRKELEAALKESERNYRVLAQTSPDGILATDANGSLTFVNSALEEIFDIPASASTGTHFRGYLAAESARQAEEVFLACMKGQIVKNVELDAIHRDGHVFPIEISASSLFRGEEFQGVECVVRDITERKQAEEALRESEEQLHLAMESGRVGGWEWEVGTEHVEWSHGFYALLGYKPNEVAATRQAFRQRIHPQDLARQEEALRESMERCDDYLCEYRVVWTDGSVHWVEDRGQYAYVDGENGVLLRMRGVLADIGRRKQAEESLRISQERLALAASGTQIGMYDRDLVTGEALCTEQFARLLGLRTTTTTTLSPCYHYHDWIGRVHPEDLVRVEAERGRCMAAQVACETQYRIVWPDGSVHWVADRGVFQYDPDGRPTRILGILMDITERQRGEEALRESENRLRRFYESGLIGVIYWNMEGKITDANDKFLEMVGYSREDLRAGAINWINMTPPEYRHLDEASGKELKARGVNKMPFEKEYIRKDGTRIPIIIAGAVLDEARFNGVAFVLDITQRKRAEEALRELTATLENKVAERTAALKHRAAQLQKLTLEVAEAEDRERKRMAEILHDDLQQVLAATKFHLGLMKSRAKYDASLQATAAQIDHMLNDAINKSRSLSHELSPAVMHHADFAETLRWLANEVQAKHGLVVHVHADGPVRSQSDALKALLFRAAQEMLFNVVKHARVNEAQIRVRQCARCICLSVSDRGRGFDPQELQEAAGYGLLSIRERIELLGGRMKIKSAKGKGSTFRITVPAGEIGGTGAAVERRPNARAKVAGCAAGDVGDRLRVLLADDHEIVREGLISLLSEEHTVEVVGEAANGREAVDLAIRLKPDVVIMDMSMPLIDGDEATRQIKMHLPQTRVIALSMYEEPEKMEAMSRAGAERYVLKTAPSEELLAAIRGLEHKRELTRPTR